MESQNKFDVMISYAHKSGKECMEKILKLLEDNGLTVWVDRREVVSRMDDDIAKGITSSHVLVALISKAYYDSLYCQDELAYAKNRKKNIIPVKVEDYTPPESSGIAMTFNTRFHPKIYGDFDETEKLMKVIKKYLDNLKNAGPENQSSSSGSSQHREDEEQDLQPTASLPTQESVGNQNQTGTEDGSFSSGSRHQPEGKEQALTDGMGSLNVTSEDEGQLDASHILNDRVLLLKMANMLEPSNALEQLAMSFNFTAGEITQIMHGSKPTQYFFTNLASREGSIKLSDLKNLIEGDELQTKKITIFPRIITDINNERVRFTLESTLAEIASDGEHWLYFLENIANELPSNGFGINSWEDVAGYYKYTQIEINNFRMRHSDTQRPTEVFFEILSHKEHVPTISTVKKNLKQRQRYDVIRVIDAWLQKPKN